MDVGWPMLAQTGLIQIAVMSDRLVLSLISGAEEVAEYSLVFQVFAPIGALMTTMALSLWPLFTQRLRSGQRLHLVRFSGGFFAVTALAGVIILLARDPISNVLSGGAISIDAWIVGAFIAANCAQAALYPIGMSMMDARSLRFQVLPILTSVTVNVGLSIPFASWWGAPGPIFATAIATVICQLIPFALYVKARSGTTRPA